MTPDQTISGETFSEPYRPGPEVITPPVIVAVSQPYSMLATDYVYLTKTVSGWSEWAVRFVIAAGLAILQPIGNYISVLLKGLKPEVQLTDYVLAMLALAVASVLWIIGKCLPNERAKVLEKMKHHFDNAPTTIEVRKP